MQRRQRCKDKGRDWCDVTPSPGLLGLPPGARKAKEGFSLRTLERAQSSKLRKCERINFYVSRHQVCGNLFIYFFFFTATSVNLDTWQGQTQVYRGPHQLSVMALELWQEAVLWSKLCGPLPGASPDSLIFIVPHTPFSLLENFSPPGEGIVNSRISRNSQ